MPLIRELDMSLMNLLKQAQGGQGLGQLGQQLGLDPSMVEKLVGQIAPAISGGVKQRAQAEGGLGAILGQLQGEHSAQYFDQPQQAAAPQARAQGEDFLESIFGTRDAAPRLAQAAAEKVGAPVDKAQELLPALAAMLQGGMQKQAPDNDIGAMMQGLQQTGADKAGLGLGDLMGALGGGQGGGGLGGILGALGGGKSDGGGLGGMLGGLMGGGTGDQQTQAGGLGGLLQMLDQDGDGSPMDDIVGMLMKK